MDSRRPSTHIRSFGSQEPLLEDATPTPSTAHRILGRISFSSLRRGRPSFLNPRNGDSTSTPSTERPPIPTMMTGSGEAYMTPLPKLSMVVLSIVSPISSLFVWAILKVLIDLVYARRISLGQCINTISTEHGQG